MKWYVMKNLNPDTELELEALESHLAGILKPVAPPKSVVQRLRGRIRLP